MQHISFANLITVGLQEAWNLQEFTNFWSKKNPYLFIKYHLILSFRLLMFVIRIVYFNFLKINKIVKGNAEYYGECNSQIATITVHLFVSCST
jgi:hypothetical protein